MLKKNINKIRMLRKKKIKEPFPKEWFLKESFSDEEEYQEKIADEQNIHFVKGWLFGFFAAVLINLKYLY